MLTLGLLLGLSAVAHSLCDYDSSRKCNRDTACMWSKGDKKCVMNRGRGLGPPPAPKPVDEPVSQVVFVDGFGTIGIEVPGMKEGQTEAAPYSILLQAAKEGDNPAKTVFEIKVDEQKVTINWVAKPTSVPDAWSSKTLENIILDANYQDWWPENLLKYKDSVRHMWVSIDGGSNSRIRVGFGYMMVLNTILEWSSGMKETVEAIADEKTESPLYQFNRAIRSVHSVAIGGRTDITKLRLERAPVVSDPYPVAVHPDDWNLWMIAQNDATNINSLPKEAQDLYALVAGPSVQLSDFDADAINFSIDTEGMYLNELLKNKTTEFGIEPNPNEVYVRCTIGNDEGQSPGIPYVLEIWPRLCYSPVHSHSNASAIIKVLHGEITVTNYNQLQDVEDMVPFAKYTYGKGGVTWITPELYQTHQLYNARNDTACITIQSYRYPGNDRDHYEYFDYVHDDKIDDEMVRSIGHFYPESDISFEELLGTVRTEFINSEAFELSMQQHRNTPFRNEKGIYGALSIDYL